MNILPKKSWHVRNKDNVARVRRDEAEAEKQRQKREARVLLADQEARTDFLRKKARLSAVDDDSTSALTTLDSEEPSRHLNLFQELQAGGNKEYEEEKRQEKERQEKALGILTYLGQSAAEAQSGRPWYQELPERCEVVKDEKLKGKLDPLLEMEKHLHKKKGAHSKEGKKEKGEQRQKDSRRNLALGPTPSSSSVEQLRQERLRREKAERVRAEALLAQRAGTALPREEEVDERKRSYNSQFHPQLARRKGWQPQ